MSYISREALEAWVRSELCSLDTDEDREYVIERWRKEIPAADVREVIRCADCKWFQCNMRQDGYLPKSVPEFECRHWCSEVDPTDFCSRGEKMEERI